MNFVTLLCTMYKSPLGERVLIISCRMRTIILTRLFKDAVYFWVVYVRPCLGLSVRQAMAGILGAAFRLVVLFILLLPADGQHTAVGARK